MKKAYIIKSILIIIATVFGVLGYCYGKNIPFSEQWPLFEALRTTASIIFAVVGAWLAIIYPERLKFTFKPTEKKTSSNSNIGKLLHPAINSTVILCVILVIGILAPIIKQFSFIQDSRDVARGISYFILVMLTIWQLWTIILTLIPADMIKIKSDEENEEKKTLDDLFVLTQKSDKK